MKTRIRNQISAGLALALLSLSSARASCGSASCPVNTQWDVQSAWQTPGWRVDLQYDFLDQDQPRHGRDAIDVGEIRGHHDEIATLNRNTLLNVGYTFNANWGVAVSLPHVNRQHQHIHHHHGEDLLDVWNISAVGDVRAIGHYRPTSRPLSILFGLKLPTGRTDSLNDEGILAERSLQPGTGTTDALLGIAWRHADAESDLSWFAQAQLQHPLSQRDGFKPGEQWLLDAGLRYAATQRVSLLLQNNLIIKTRDSGSQAEPATSGGTFLYLTPGLSVSLSARTQAYVFLQQPLYQRVNGVQLTADRGFSAGLSVRF